MKFFTMCTRQFLRRDGHGKVFFAPSGNVGPVYHVPTEAAEELFVRRFARFLAGLLAALIVTIGLFGSDLRGFFVIWTLAVTSAVAFGHWVAKDFPRARVAWRDLSQ